MTVAAGVLVHAMHYRVGLFSCVTVSSGGACNFMHIRGWTSVYQVCAYTFKTALVCCCCGSLHGVSDTCSLAVSSSTAVARHVIRQGAASCGAFCKTSHPAVHPYTSAALRAYASCRCVCMQVTGHAMLQLPWLYLLPFPFNHQQNQVTRVCAN